MVYAFVYSTCEDVCPAQVQTIKGALDDLDREDVQGRRHLRRSRQRHAQAGRLVPAQAGHDGPDGVPHGHARGARAGVEGVRHPAAAGRTWSTQPHTILADANGMQRIGFPFDQMTQEALAHDLGRL